MIKHQYFNLYVAKKILVKLVYMKKGYLVTASFTDGQKLFYLKNIYL